MDDRRIPDIDHLFDCIQLTQSSHPLGITWHCIEHLVIALLDVTNVPQPIIDQAMWPILHRRLDATAPVVPADDHMLDLKNIHRVLKNRQAIHICVNDQIGDVAVNKQLAWKQSDDLIRRNSAVCTANPEEFGCLLLGKPREELRISRTDTGCPFPVILK
jgi:hypothetical protein